MSDDTLRDPLADLLYDELFGAQLRGDVQPLFRAEAIAADLAGTLRANREAVLQALGGQIVDKLIFMPDGQLYFGRHDLEDPRRRPVWVFGGAEQ